MDSKMVGWILNTRNSSIKDGCADIVEEGWRLPFGETGILDVVMNIIASPGIDDDLAKQSLRIVGNSCIDTGWED